jgi:protein PhnA
MVDVKTVDANGAELFIGDSLIAVKDLKIKGSSKGIKRGDVFTKIKLIGKKDRVECRVGKMVLELETQYFKKKPLRKK